MTTKKRNENKKIRERMKKCYYTKGYDFEDFWMEYDGPKSRQSIRDIWNHMLTEEASPEDYMSETVRLIDTFYYRMKLLLQYGVDISTLEDSVKLSHEEFRSFMIILRKATGDKYWDLWEEGISYLGG